MENTRKVSNASSDCSKASCTEAVISTQENEDIGGNEDNSDIGGNDSNEGYEDQDDAFKGISNINNSSSNLCDLSLYYCLCCDNKKCLCNKEVHIYNN